MKNRTPLPSRLFGILAVAASTAWPAYTAAAEGPPGPDHPFLRYHGRWDRKPEGAITVNTGSEILAAFRGPGLAFRFDVSNYKPPLPQLWLRVNEGRWRDVEIAQQVAVKADGAADKTHVVRLVVKGLREKVRRWDPPLEAAVVFKGLALEEGARLTVLPPPPRYRIEFLGDSITEGILAVRKGERSEWPSLCDGRRAYAFQTAERLGFEPRIVGFGRLGIIVAGNGGVPRAIESFPYIYRGVEKDRWKPTVVVVNLGTNDYKARPRIFQSEYYLYVRTIRRSYKRAHILCMRPLNGAHAPYVEAAVRQLRKTEDERIHYVDTTGWIDPETDTTDGLHPNIEGHRKVAEKLSRVIFNTLGKR